MNSESLTYRLATQDDVFALMKLHQLCSTRPTRDPLMVDYRALSAALVSGTDFWLIGENAAHEPVTAVSVMQDREQRLCKLHRLYVHPKVAAPGAAAKAILLALRNHLEADGETEMLYTTTWKLNLLQIELTRELGFRMLGIFPTVRSGDTSKMNAVSAYFFREVHLQRRFAHFKLHPALQPLYEIVRRECGLPETPLAPAFQGEDPNFREPLPVLEVIEAPNFVARRFERLKERKFLSMSFYPFQAPNVVITGPNQETEVFVRTVPELRFAMVIGERLDRPVNPAELYSRVAEILSTRGITYVEVINDAADVTGVDFILRAGYLPCVYFPCLKRHGESRRDYIVFGRAMEKTQLHSAKHSPLLQEFLEQYLKLDKVDRSR